MILESKYTYTNYSLGFTLLAAALLSCLYTWHDPASIHFVDGDARYYYYYLQSTFVDPQLVTYEWLSGTGGTPITHHPVGLSLLLLPFFLLGWLVAALFQYPLTGLSLPFQAALSLAALVYCAIGLIYLKKLFRLHGISDKVTALVIPLIFFGTNLLHYTLSEPAMSHAYSFSLITVFMYHSCRFVRERQTKNLYAAALVFGLILLVRANNGLVVFTVLFWFSSAQQCADFFKNLFRQRAFYYAVLLVGFLVMLQPLTWYFKESQLFVNRYAPYGFYWTHPAFFKMLFGFNGGFFIYTPLCFLFLSGLLFTYKPNRFLFFSVSVFLLLLFYFFSAYSAYTYFDGLGIRVLVDYYGLFALLGARLFSRFEAQQLVYSLIAILAVLLSGIGLVYSYQDSVGILARSGMNYAKWRYVFLKTGDAYRGCIGGSNDLVPFSNQPVAPALTANAKLDQPFDFSKKDYGVALSFDSLGFRSNRVCLKIDVNRKEEFANSSSDALVCAMLEDRNANHKNYVQFRLNEIPAGECCPEKEYHYVANLEADFKADDRLSVYLWNIKLQSFFINKFSVEVYNYAYQTN